MESKPVLKRVKYALIIFFIRLAVITVRYLPRGLELFRFKMRGRWAFYLLAHDRKRTIKHLTRAYYGEKSREEIIRMARDVYEHQAMNGADFLRTLHYNTKKEFDAIWEVEGEEHLAAAYNKGRGVIVSVAHVGCWEFSAIAPSILGYKNSGVSAPLKNERINRLMMESRERRGMKNILRGGGKALPQILDELKSGACNIIMIDQDVVTKGCFVDFYGREAFTPVGAAKIAAVSGSPVVSMCCRRLPNNKHQLIFRPEVELQSTGDEKTDLIENTKRIHSELEVLIRKTPNQWVWMHRRWRRNRKTIDPRLVVE